MQNPLQSGLRKAACNRAHRAAGGPRRRMLPANSATAWRNRTIAACRLRFCSPTVDPSLHPSPNLTLAAPAAPLTMREGTTTMNRTSVTLTLLALGLLLLLAVLRG
jgi:hypothetical protein